jgi:hypothetical protein
MYSQDIFWRVYRTGGASRYASLDLSAMESLYELEGDFYSYFGGDWYRNKIWTG